MLGGPNFTVPLGRLDGCFSTANAATQRLPSAQATVHKTFNGALQSLEENFRVQGLNLKDLVALSGMLKVVWMDKWVFVSVNHS